MKKWAEVINPSDKIHICIDDEPAAVLATMYAGEGAYGLSDSNGKEVSPLFLFGYGDPAKWFLDKYGFEMNTVPVERVVAAAHTAQYGSIEEIESIQAAIADLPEEARNKAWATYQDRKRSSMNRIVDTFHSFKVPAQGEPKK